MTTDTASGYRWVIVLAAAIMLALAMGQLVNGLSTFFEPLEQAEGWRRAEVSFINTAGLVGLALGGIVMGALADRTSIRAVILTGALGFGLTMIAASRAEALWQLYILFFIAGAIGGGALFSPLFAVVGGWFRTGAGLAIGLVSAGQALGQGGVPFANALLIETFGWRGALFAIGLVALAVLVPLAVLVRPAKADVPSPRGPTGMENAETLPATKITALLSLAVIFCCCLMSVPLMHLAPLIQTCGFPATDAAGVVLVMMLTAIAGRVAFGRLADMIGAVRAYLVASIWQTALVFGFALLSDLSHFYLFAPIYGFGYAGVMTGVLTSVRQLVPATRQASVSGVVIAFAWLGHGLGGALGGSIYDLNRAYTLAFAIAALAGVINLGLVWTLLRISSQPSALVGANDRHRVAHANVVSSSIPISSSPSGTKCPQTSRQAASYHLVGETMATPSNRFSVPFTNAVGRRRRWIKTGRPNAQS